MKKILAFIRSCLKYIAVRFTCLFKLTFRLGVKEDESEGNSANGTDQNEGE